MGCADSGRYQQLKTSSFPEFERSFSMKADVQNRILKYGCSNDWIGAGSSRSRIIFD